MFDISALDKPVNVELKGLAQGMDTPGSSRFFSGAGMAAIAKAIPEQLPHSGEIQFVSKGDWSLWELVDYIIGAEVSVNLYFATWTISELSSRKLVEWVESGRIAQMHAVVDHRTKVRHEAAYHLFAGRATRIRATRCHAKVTVLQFIDGRKITILGSSNWTKNPRIEVGMIRTDHATADMHKSWIIEQIETDAD